MILELEFPNCFSLVFLSIALLISSFLPLSESVAIIMLRFFWRCRRLMMQIFVSVPFYLLLSFSVFTHLPSWLYTLFANVNEIRWLLSFSFLVAVFAIVVRVSFFLVVLLLSQQRTLTVKKSRMRGSMTFDAFILL